MTYLSNTILVFATLVQGLAMPTQAHSAVKPGQTLLAQSVHKLKPLVSSPLWACDQHIKKHPDDITCPASCPYLRAEPTRLCQFKCVPAFACNSDNPLASFANPASMRCEACKVAGCHRCGNERTACAACQDGFELTDGLCLSRSRHLWHAFFAFLGALGIFLLYYLFALFYLRCHNNEAAMKAGLSFREHSIVRVKNSRGLLDKINLFKNLMDDKEDVAGAGVMLHFRWMGAIGVWAAFAMVLFGVAGLLFWDRLGVMHRPNSRASYEACEDNVHSQKQAYNNMEAVYFVCTMILYIFTFLGSLWFASFQKQAYQTQDLKNVTMRDFTLVATGFPVCRGSDKVEERHLDFFKASPQFSGLDVVGVSECWDFRAKAHEVEEQLRREFDIREGSMDVAHAEMTQAASDYAGSKQRSCFDPRLQCVDAVLGIGKYPCARSGDQEMPAAHDVKEMLHEFETSGQLFVTLGSTKHFAEAYKRCNEKPLVYEQDGKSYDLKVEETEAEPLTVIWKGFGTENGKFMMSLVLGCIVVFVCVLVLDLCFYAPYVYYILSYSNVAGMSQGGMISGLLLGLLITVCNQCIYLIIGSVADRCGWTNSDSKDCFYCVKYTLAVFFNTCLDLATVLILAQGYSVDMAMEMQIANDSTMSAKAIAEAPNMQKALYVQLVAYIWPSCTLLPFLIEPFATTVMPYYIGKALVRSRREVSVQDAEECLQNPPYDLSRYGDVLVNMMLCCMTLLFTYRDLWMLYFFLIISMAIIYAWDQLRVLRFTTKTMFSTSSLDNAVMYMMAMPCAVIAMCLVFKAYGASHHGFLDSLREEHHGGFFGAMNRSSVVPYMIAAFLVHIVMHWMLLNFVVLPITEKRVEQVHSESGRNLSEGTYAECGAARPACYFNTNPVNCLRSKYVYKHDPPCIFYRAGKEHLIQKNKDIGILFDAKNMETPRSVRSDTDHSLRNEAGRLRSNLAGFASGA